MSGEKTYVNVFVTKSLNFRARVREAGASPFEITIGGSSWLQGRLLTLHNSILYKLNQTFFTLLCRFFTINHGSNSITIASGKRSFVITQINKE